MTEIKPYYVLNSQETTLIVDCGNNVPAILYWGSRLSKGTTPDMLKLLATGQAGGSRPDRESPIALSPELGAGFQGNPGIQVHRNGQQWATYSKLTEVVEAGKSLTFVSRCATTQIELQHQLNLDEVSGVLAATTTLSNTGDSELTVEQCNCPAIPLPMHYSKILGFEGRWANEFQTHQVDRFMGSYLRENRAGRTSHDTFPGVVVHTAQTNEQHGGAYGLHLGWSGNHRTRVEEEATGRCSAQMGELFFPGEIQLAPGEQYQSPTLFAAFSQNGFSGLSRCFHRYVRRYLTDARILGKEKPVHFNTWEAMYFDLDMQRLCALADAAAKVGVERFVLDDGWFRNRNSDKAGLGDWYVDSNKFPDGLSPLIQHVNGRGMEFGLWVEPEMVNPDSDLYRAHPDWVLHTDPAPRIIARHQLVLDLARKEVRAYLFERLDALLREYPITYLKWDMNRNLDQPGGNDGRAATHRRTIALYELLARIRNAHPTIEIESCASGGARADFGILQYTDRIWTSDSNDALDRLRIQKGFSYFFPPEFMGAHVGPLHCHITGRTLSMSMRAGVAMFGDMGIEANLLEMDEREQATLARAVALHKQHRKLILGGELLRMNLEAHEHGFGVISLDGGEALFCYVQMASNPTSTPGRFRFVGLQPDASYRLDCVWPQKLGRYAGSILDLVSGETFTGESLMEAGMQLPIMKPETILVFHLGKAL